MRSVPTWVDKVVDNDKNEQPIYDMCFHPDGCILVVAAGNRVLVYDTSDGSLVQPLKGHTGNVYCVSYSRDGKRFASGSQDKSVVIWAAKSVKSDNGTYQIEGILRYTHKDSVQCVCYNPLSSMLLSCSLGDFGLWSPDQKNVIKYSVNSRITSCCWTTDGIAMALALTNGTVSIRTKNGDEKGRVERGAPVWCVRFSPARADKYEVLAVADWSPTISLYAISTSDFKIAEIAHGVRRLDYDPCTLMYFPRGQYLLSGGSNRELALYTKDAVRLDVVAQQEAWIWCCAVRSDADYVACGCNDGTIAYYQLVFSTVHGLHRERYAYRENMTDVVIQHMATEQKVRIKCRDMVKKVALYGARLAVQLPERIVIYELYTTGSTEMHYRVKDKLDRSVQCSQMVICSNHIILCRDRRLQCMNWAGDVQREWTLDSMIRYVKVVGGAENRECLLVGLKDGHIYKIFIDNAFPLSVLRIPSAVRCLDLSAFKSKLAVIDEGGTLMVYNVDNKELLFQEPNASSVAFNMYLEDMICYSGGGALQVKAANYQPFQQKVEGFVVGYSGRRVFILSNSTMRCVDVPQSAPMYQYIEHKQLDAAYSMACLGVSHDDWEALGSEALNNLDLEVAKKAYMRVKNMSWLQLIYELEEKQRKGEFNEHVFMGDILAYRGQFREAAELYVRAGNRAAALQMYTDLRMFDLAQEFAGDADSVDRRTLLHKRAEWARDTNELRSAAEMYMGAGETAKAVQLMGEHGWIDLLIETGRRLDKVETRHITAVAQHLRHLKQYALAAEMYRKLGETESMIGCHVEAESWEEAFTLAEQHPEHRQLVYVPYANWLAEHDRFLDAQKALHKAGRMDLAFLILQQLTVNAVDEHRFSDAGFYHWVLSLQCLEAAKERDEERDGMVRLFHEHQRKANIYYAYHAVHRYIEEPFTEYMPEALFNIARYLCHQLMTLHPRGVSKFCVLYALAKQGKLLEAYKVARYAFNKIQQIMVPLRFQENVDVAGLQVRGKPYTDKDELLPLCYRCSAVNPLVNPTGSRCINCSQPFVFSFISFEVLTLVEFQLEDDITDEEALRLIELSISADDDADEKTAPADSDTMLSETNGRSWKESRGGQSQTLVLNETSSSAADAFTRRLMVFQQADSDYIPVLVDRATLRAMVPADIIVCRWSAPLRFQYFRNLMPDMPISHCVSCNRLFLTDDFELHSLQKGCCPFCRHITDHLTTE